MFQFSSDLVWWVTIFDLPAMAGLFWLIWRAREEARDAVDDVRMRLDRRCDQLREALTAFKLEAAKTYASQNDLRDLEKRLTSHLLRIEAKLDITSLTAEMLKAKTEH